MKSNLKKHLLFTLAVVALMALFTMGASAKCDVCVIDDNLNKVVYPTCTTGGYTEQYCGVCHQFVANKALTNPTGHNFKGKDYFYESQENGKYHYYKCVCSNTNKNNGKACKEVTYNSDKETGYPIKYYTVTFYNPCVTDTYETDITYTSLAKTLKTVELGKIYVAEGDKAVYTGVLPTREKDKQYGEYVFTGWDKSLNNITENSSFNAVFQGAPKYYTVTFVDGDNNQISSQITVTHGVHDPKILTLFENNPPKKSDTPLYKYEFTNWDKDIYCFYDTCTVYPQFEKIEKVYTYVYHGYDGKEFYRTNLTASSSAPVFSDSQKLNKINKPDDEKYMYEWTGQWRWVNTDININVPTQIPGDIKEGEEIHLYPVYIKKLIQYDIIVRVRFLEENPYYNLDEFVVNVMNADGQLISSGYTDENGEFLCKINYSYPVYITVTSTDTRCSGDASLNILYKDYPTVANIFIDAKAAVNNPAYDCSCICHNSLFKSIWVKVLNILYNLFNVKYVCCDDMYASIGDLLAYTAK